MITWNIHHYDHAIQPSPACKGQRSYTSPYSIKVHSRHRLSQRGKQMEQDHERFVDMAIEEAGKAEAAGDEPFGCVIVLNGEVVVRERNHIHTANDPTAHAETSAIRAAARNLARGAAKTFR